MSLDKAIEHGKEKRKAYRGAKAVDGTCRNHGSCPACNKKREYKKTKQEMKSKELLNSFKTPDPSGSEKSSAD